MSTQIVDNFKLNVAKPIDSRMVTYGTASRNSLQFIYEGLRVYDVVNKAPYVYINNGWQQESGSSIISGGGGGSVDIGTVNRLLKYTSTGATNSAIHDNGTFTQPSIGIGKIPVSGVALDVKGSGVFSSSVTATLFIGNLDGANILTKSLLVERISPGADNQILKTVGSGNNAIVQWTDQSSTNSNISIQSQTSAISTHYLLFSDLTGSVSTLNSNIKIGVKPSTSQILGSGDASTNSAGAPSYAFLSNTTAGLYGNATEIGLSFGGKALLKLNNTNLSILDTVGATLLSSNNTSLGINFGASAFIKSQTTSAVSTPDYSWQSDLTTGMYRPAAGQIGFSTAGVNKLTLSATENKFFGGLTIDGGSVSIDGTGAYLGVNGLASVRDLSVIRNIQFKPDPSFNTLPQPGIGKVLTSDADGFATWQSPASGIPNGAIIAWWIANSIPSGWFVCSMYTPYGFSPGVNGFTASTTGTFKPQIYLQQANVNGYVDIPILVDKVLTAGITYTTGGTISPYEQPIIGPRTAAPMAPGLPQAGFNGVYTLSSPSGSLLTTSGITKYQQMIWVIKFNPSAAVNTPGHIRLLDTAPPPPPPPGVGGDGGWGVQQDQNSANGTNTNNLNWNGLLGGN